MADLCRTDEATISRSGHASAAVAISRAPRAAKSVNADRN
jgi:hypothetical protein